MTKLPFAHMSIMIMESFHWQCITIRKSNKKYNSLAGAALFGRVPRRGDDEAGEHDDREIRGANASCLSSSRFHSAWYPGHFHRRNRRRRHRRLPPGCTRPSLRPHGATSVTSALLSPRPQNEPAAPSERCQASWWKLPRGDATTSLERRSRDKRPAETPRASTRRELPRVMRTRAPPSVPVSGDPGVLGVDMWNCSNAATRKILRDSLRKVRSRSLRYARRGPGGWCELTGSYDRTNGSNSTEIFADSPWIPQLLYNSNSGDVTGDLATVPECNRCCSRRIHDEWWTVMVQKSA